MVERKIPSVSADGTLETYADETELACTPFHVRFGKLSVLRPSDRRVVVRVNGKEVPLAMKVGETGEAFFVFETEDTDIPEDMQTSPLAKPIRDQDPEPEPLDLGDAADQRPPDRESKTNTKPAKTAGKDLADASSGGTALAQSAAARMTQMGSLVAAEAAHVAGNTLPFPSREKRSREKQQVERQPDATKSGRNTSADNDEIKDLERRMAESLDLDPTLVATSDHDMGSDARDAAKRANSLTEHGRQLEDQGVASTNAQAHQFPASSLSSSLNHKHDLMLDMAGYKVGNEEQSKAKSIESHLLAGEVVGEKLGEDVLLFTQSLLRSADLEKSRHGAKVLEQYHKAKPSISASTGTFLFFVSLVLHVASLLTKQQQILPHHLYPLPLAISYLAHPHLHLAYKTPPLPL